MPARSLSGRQAGHRGVSAPRFGRSTFLANLALGYYFTPHDMIPIGDTVWYVSTNLTQDIDHRGPNTTTLTLTPGFRVHLGATGTVWAASRYR